MFSIEPRRTDYDVNFQCLGFPVRVHPLFWLAGLILGANGVWSADGEMAENAGVHLLSWIFVVFVSILVHELGHSFVMRYFGQSSHIVLYMLGGLAVPDSSYSSFSKPSRLTPRGHILISLAGPCAGFALAGLTVVLGLALGFEFARAVGFPYYWLFPGPSAAKETIEPLAIVIDDLLWVNIFWGLVNLLPVFPLDGGQVARELFQLADPGNGFVRSLWLSIFTAVGVAIAGFMFVDSILLPLMFISLAATNYMILQQLSGGGPGGGRW